MGQLEAIDFNLIFRLLREGVTLAQIRKWYWEREDYLFMAPVHTVIDIARFTFTWRGRVLIARAFPDTSTLSSGDLVLIRRLPASSEYFTIIYTEIELFVATIIPGGLGIPKLAYCTPAGSATVWKAAVPPPDTKFQKFYLDVSQPSVGYSLSANSTTAANFRIYRSLDVKTTAWTTIMDSTIFYAATGISSDSNDAWSLSAIHSVKTAPGLIAVVVDFGDASVGNRPFIFHSHDFGTTWEAPVEVGATIGQTSISRQWTALAISEADPDIIYVQIFNTAPSPDRSETWKSIDRCHSFIRVDDAADDTTFYADYLSVKRTNANTVWGWGGGTEGLWESLDAGFSWVQKSTFPRSATADGRPVHQVPNTAKMIATERTPIRFNLSLDEGQTWSATTPTLAATVIEDAFVVRDGVYAIFQPGFAGLSIPTKVSTYDDALVQTDITTNLLTLWGYNYPQYAGMAVSGMPFY